MPQSPVPSFAPLATLLGVTPQREGLWRQALTHRSAVSKAEDSYERLEFLGDRVLALAMAQLLLARFPEEQEGPIALRHATLVKENQLAAVAKAWGLGPLLVLGASEEKNTGRQKDSILADVVESLLAVVFLENGLDEVVRIVGKAWEKALQNPDALVPDPKTALQEWLQARGEPLPVYEVVAEVGPEHAKQFEVKVTSLAGIGQGVGKNKKEAETAAAAAVMQQHESKTS